jgi:hypothetical protein
VKKPIVVLIAFLCFQTAIAQLNGNESSAGAPAEELSKVLTTEIVMDIDTLIYSTRNGNIYISENPDGMIMGIVAPQSFEKAKTRLDESNSRKKDFHPKDKGEFRENGRRILYRTGTFKKEGKKYVMEQYIVAVSADRSIFITGFYDPKAKSIFGNTIRKAAVSARMK